MSNISKRETTYSYLNEKGLVEVIDIETGIVLLVQKSLEDIFNDKINRAQLTKLPDGTEVWIEAGINLDEIPNLNKWKYSNTLANIICQQIAEGGRITKICGKNGIPPYAIISMWRKQNNEFKELLLDAEKARADYCMDQVLGIAEDAKEGMIDKDSVAASRLAMEGYDKGAASGDPKKFGKARDQQVRVENLIILNTGINHPVEKIASPIQVIVSGDDDAS